MNGKVNLNIISKKPMIQKNFVMHAILNYRLKFETIMELFDINTIFSVETEEDLYRILVNKYSDSYFAFLYLINYENYDQETAKKDFLNFMEELRNIAKQNIQEARDYLKIFYDNDIKLILHKNISDLTEEEMMKVVKYQLKYALANTVLADNFHCAESTYRTHAKKILENNLALNEKYENLMEFHSYHGKNSSWRKY